MGWTAPGETCRWLLLQCPERLGALHQSETQADLSVCLLHSAGHAEEDGRGRGTERGWAERAWEGLEMGLSGEEEIKQRQRQRWSRVKVTGQMLRSDVRRGSG